MLWVLLQKQNTRQVFLEQKSDNPYSIFPRFQNHRQHSLPPAGPQKPCGNSHLSICIIEEFLDIVTKVVLAQELCSWSGYVICITIIGHQESQIYVI